jgi:hypothetical protein
VTDINDAVPGPQREPWPGMWDFERENPKLASALYVATFMLAVLASWAGWGT